jgi:hypothetical protein
MLAHSRYASNHFPVFCDACVPIRSVSAEPYIAWAERRWVRGATHPESCGAGQGVAGVGERFLQQVVEVFATLATIARITLHVHAQGSGLPPRLAVARGSQPIRPLWWLWQVVSPVGISVYLWRALRRLKCWWHGVDVERDDWTCWPRWRHRLIWELRALVRAPVLVLVLVLVLVVVVIGARC